MIRKLFLIFEVLLKYKRKIFKVVFFEIFYSIYLGRQFYKIHNDTERSDSMPCPYYFIYKISKFLKKNFVSYAVDLGSGNGRIINFLSLKTSTKMHGFENDQEMFDYSIKNLNKKAKIEYKDIKNDEKYISFQRKAFIDFINNDFYKDIISDNDNDLHILNKFLNIPFDFFLSLRLVWKKYMVASQLDLREILQLHQTLNFEFSSQNQKYFHVQRY